MRYKIPKVGILAGVLVALVAVQSYYLREILAVLLLFSIGFAVVAVMILILFLLDRGLHGALAWTRPYTAHTVLRLHQGWVQVEQFGRKHFHRSEQPVER
jgi:hypothetical protein